MEFKLNYFKSWTMMLWKCCTQCASKFGKLSSDHRVEKVSFHSNPKERQCKRIYKLPHNYTHLISRQGFSSMWIENFQMFKLDLEKAEEPEIKLPPSVGASKKQESSRKISYCSSLTMPQHLTVWITTNCGKFFRRWEYQTTLPTSWDICMQVKKQQLELNVEQQIGSKSGKKYVKAVHCHLAYLTLM